LDTNANSLPTSPNWPLRAALAMLAAGVVAFLYVLFFAASKPDEHVGLMRFAQGEMSALRIMEDAPPMPSRSLQGPEGETSLTAFDGEVLVVNLWATWCAPCVEEMPTLAALQRSYAGRLQVIPISVDSEGELERARQKLAELSGGDLPFYADITRGVLFDVRASGMPVTILYDRNGVEVARLSGGADWSSPEAHALMEAMLAGG
jgi:thiol-disulfide isomerase/thioredoxin